jgi:2-succinyl-5-enolpyruvyl-6-hydroxy-3-cyclohexene-1-carboxylate synthase
LTPNLNALWGRVLADELARCGLRHAVIAPGSRSTPLVLAFAAHPDVCDLSVIDERSAAFVALGIARATGAPAAVVTTSGTAAANLYPAVVEADRAGVPLLLLSADRPPERRDAGDSQAADQVKLFGDRVRWFHAVAEPAPETERLAYLRSTACEAWARAVGAGGPPGPVHLDLPLRKPLEPEGDGGAVAGVDPESPGAAGRPGGAPWRRTERGRPTADPAVVEELALALAGAERPLILAGAISLAEAGETGPPGGLGLRRALARLLAVLPIPVWAEAGSQLRLGPSPGGARPAAVIGTADLLLASERFRRLARPDFVLRLGEAPLDWPLRRFAAALAAAGVRQVAVDPWARRRDPEHAVGWSIAADPARLLEAVAERLERGGVPVAAGPGWLASHRAADRASREALDRAVSGIAEPFDGGAVHRLGRLLPEDAALVVSSSMPLREVEAFLPGTDRPVDVVANRGVNGIDGVTSTALGVAEARRAGGESRTVLLTGDVAFAHDLSGALAAGRLGSDLVVVLVDNGGGAIFDYLPLPAADPAFERHFTTPPGVDFGAVAGGLGWRHEAPEDWPAFEAVLARTFGAGGGPRGVPTLIQVQTDRDRGRALRRRVSDEVAAAVERALERPPGAASGEAREAPPARRGRPAGTRAPVLLLHGFTGTGAGLAGLARPLAAAGHPVLAPDLPGHGATPVPEGGATAEASVAAALAELDRRGAAEAHWVGYSMGGRVALAAALAHPERTASLTLLSAAAGIEGEAERRERRESDEALAREIERGGLAGFVDRWMAQPLFATQARLGHRHLRHARAERLRGSACGYAASLRGAGQGAQPSLWHRLGELEMPVLLVAGEADTKYAALVRAAAERIPAGRAVVVPGAGHAVHLEAPEEVARLVSEHLRSAEAR